MLEAGWATPRRHWARIAALAIVPLALASQAFAQQKAAAPTTVLDRVKSSGKIRLGYLPDARPFSFKDASGKADGWTVALCQNVADAIKSDLGLAALNVEWVAVGDDRLQALAKGDIDLLCASDRETLSSRKAAGFSIPVFPGGIGALIRTDAPAHLEEVLTNRKSTQPNWRANSIQLLQTQIFSVVNGSPSEAWLKEKMNEFKLTAKVDPADNNDAALQKLVGRKANVLFGDRAVLLDAALHSPNPKDLKAVDRLFTYEPVAIGLSLGNWELRLAVDRALSRFYNSPGFTGLYTKWFGAPDDKTLLYFHWTALPE